MRAPRTLTPAVVLGLAFLVLTRFVRHTPLTPRELSVDRSLTARTPANFVDLSRAVDIQHWVFVVLGLAIVLVLTRHYRQALLLIVAEVLAEGLNAAIKIAVNRQFPDQGAVATGSVFDQFDVLLFPSGHVVRTTVTLGLFVLFLAWPHPRARLPAALAALAAMALIGVTQVAVGGHLPLDALGGYLLAGVVVNVIYVVDRQFSSRLPVSSRGPVSSHVLEGSRRAPHLAVPAIRQPHLPRHISARAWLYAAGVAAALLVATLAVRDGPSRIVRAPATAASAMVDHLSHPRVLLSRLHDWID